MIKESTYISFFSSLLDGDKNKCVAIINMLLKDGIAIKEIYVNLIQRAMYALGKKWTKNEISMATEHIASHITRHLMSVILTAAPKAEPKNKSVLLFCVDKEFHELGIRMISDFFELNGWKSYYLGANNPARCIISAINEKHPDVIGISFNFYMNLTRFADSLNLIRSGFPDIKIIVGGQAVQKLSNENSVLLNDIFYLKNLDEVEDFILSWK